MGNVIVTKCCQNCTKDKEGGDIAIDELENITNNNINNNGKVMWRKEGRNHIFKFFMLFFKKNY